MSKICKDCDIVLELLPLYLDGKTCEESNAFVREHLAECDQCKEVLQLMSADFSREKAAMPNVSGKSRRRIRKRTVILVGGLIGYFLLTMGIVAFAVWQLVSV